MRIGDVRLPAQRSPVATVRTIDGDVVEPRLGLIIEGPGGVPCRITRIVRRWAHGPIGEIHALPVERQASP